MEILYLVIGVVVGLLLYHIVLLLAPEERRQKTGLPEQVPIATQDEEYWTKVRNQFPLTRERIYFNCGGLGPAPLSVLNRVHDLTMQLETVCEHGHTEYLEAAKDPVSKFLGVAPGELCFTRNATEATSIVASGLELQPGDEVILETHAHPGGCFPWLNLWKKYGVVIKLFTPSNTSAQENVNSVKQLITPKTRVVQVSHITAPTGIVMPVKQIAQLCEQHHIWFHIDGAQSLGQLNFKISELGCHSFAASCHKWMLSPFETGLLWIRNDLLDRVKPVEIGAYCESLFNLHPIEFEYFKTARRYEYGTRDAAKIQGMVAAIEFLEQIGMSQVEYRVKYLAQTLMQGLVTIPTISILTPIDQSMFNGMVTFKSSIILYSDLFNILVSKYKMRARVVTEESLNALRISTHIFNLTDDVYRLLVAIREIVHARLISNEVC